MLIEEQNGNFAKPVLAAGGIIQHKSLIGTLKKVF